MRRGHYRWRFEPSLEAPREARHVVSEWLGPSHPSYPLARLLVSEVVTNVVRHAAGPAELRADVRPDGVRFEVEDCSPGPVSITGEAGVEGGFGLRAVDALASSWGASAADSGKVVWFELDDRLSERADSTT